MQVPNSVLLFERHSVTNANVYRNIRNGFKNHITIIEKNYIAIYIDSELLSSPMFNYTKQLIMVLEMCHNIPQKNGVSVLPQFIFETNIQ